MTAQDAHEGRAAGYLDGNDRRGFPRQMVDCPVSVSAVSGSSHFHGRLSDLSLGGCLVVAEQRYTAGILVRVEVQFQLRGISFRIVGVTAGSRGAKTFAVRFLDLPMRRRQELADVLDEVAAANAAKAAQGVESLPGE
jgi:c-di-GMP-binding flagellar brake protein YcgR